MPKETNMSKEMGMSKSEAYRELQRSGRYGTPIPDLEPTGAARPSPR